MTKPALAVRREALDRLASESFDVLVVGGGVTGAGAALDAASRGLRVALVEREDLGAGTSSRSSKLIHGGLRYLEQFQFRLVRQALAERRRLLRLAPHLVRIEPFLVPVYGTLLSLGYIGAGLTLYDVLGARHDGGRTRFLGRRAVQELAPPLRPRGLVGGLVYHDGVEDDARFVLAVARTAAREGAVIATRARAIATRRRDGRVTGATVRDELTGGDLDVTARTIVDATGASGGFDVATASPSGVVPSRGAHLVIRRARLPIAHGMTIRVPGRVVFVIPWGELWIVGTTDVPHEGPTHRPAATAAEIDYLLDSINAVLDVGLTAHDIVATYAGVRPLAESRPGLSTVQTSREHRIERVGDGLLRIRGGKYTTYRLMGADIVDVVLDEAASSRPSITHDLPLVGALPREEHARVAGGLEREFGVAAEVAAALVARYGAEADDVVRLGRELDLLRPLVDGSPYLEAEVVWGARREFALSVDDIVARRTRLAIETADHGASVAPRVAALLGAELGWSAAEVAAAAASDARSLADEYGVPDGVVREVESSESVAIEAPA